MADIVKKSWSEDEVQQLKGMYSQGIDTRDIAAKMGRTRRSIRGKAHCLGLFHMTRDDYIYTAEEDDFLIKNAKTMTRAEIGKAIGRSEGYVSRRGERLEIDFQDPSKKAQYTKNMHFFTSPNSHLKYQSRSINVSIETSLDFLDYNMKQVISILGARALIGARYA